MKKLVVIHLLHKLYLLFIDSNDATKISTKSYDCRKYLSKNDVISMIIDGTIAHFKNLKIYCEDCKLLNKYPNKPKELYAHFCQNNMQLYGTGVEMGDFPDWDTNMFENLSCEAVNHEWCISIGREIMHNRDWRHNVLYKIVTKYQNFARDIATTACS